MTVLTQPPSLGDILKYELNPNYTRETVTLLAGTTYPVGTVLGRITASGKYKLATSGGTDGAQTAAAMLLYPVDASGADGTGLIIARGPTIVSKAALALTPPSMMPPKPRPSTASSQPLALFHAIPLDPVARPARPSLLTPHPLGVSHDPHSQPV